MYERVLKISQNLSIITVAGKSILLQSQVPIYRLVAFILELLLTELSQWKVWLSWSPHSDRRNLQRKSMSIRLIGWQVSIILNCEKKCQFLKLFIMDMIQFVSPINKVLDKRILVRYFRSHLKFRICEPFDI